MKMRYVLLNKAGLSQNFSFGKASTIRSKSVERVSAAHDAFAGPAFCFFSGIPFRMVFFCLNYMRQVIDTEFTILESGFSPERTGAGGKSA
jgi:hypothetical protein